MLLDTYYPVDKYDDVVVNRTMKDRVYNENIDVMKIPLQEEANILSLTDQYFKEVLDEKKLEKQIEEAELYMDEYQKMKYRAHRTYGKTKKQIDLDKEAKKIPDYQHSLNIYNLLTEKIDPAILMNYSIVRPTVERPQLYLNEFIKTLTGKVEDIDNPATQEMLRLIYKYKYKQTPLMSEKLMLKQTGADYEIGKLSIDDAFIDHENVETVEEGIEEEEKEKRIYEKILNEEKNEIRKKYKGFRSEIDKLYEEEKRELDNDLRSRMISKDEYKNSMIIMKNRFQQTFKKLNDDEKNDIQTIEERIRKDIGLRVEMEREEEEEEEEVKRGRKRSEKRLIEKELKNKEEEEKKERKVMKI